MKILQLVTERQYRGAQVFAAELSSTLADRGHHIIFAGLYPPGSNPLDVVNAVNIDLNGQKKAFDLKLFQKLKKLITVEKPDIVQANGSDTLKYAAAVKMFIPGTSLLYRNISMVSSWSKIGSVKRSINALLFKQVDRVTSVGRQSLDDLVSTYGYPLEKAKVIRRGIPSVQFDRTESRERIVKEFGLNAGDLIIMHVGQFSPEKNHPFLVEAFRHALITNARLRMIFIGEGKKMEEVRSLVNSLSLEEKIIFAGYRSNVQEMLAGADLFVLGSTIEGVPGVVLEAAVQGVPAIAVATGGVGEVVKDGETGLLLDEHNARTFADAILRLAGETELRITLGTQAKAFALDNYSLKSCTDGFEDLYQELINEKRRLEKN